jgi:hypothetical protein
LAQVDTAALVFVLFCLSDRFCYPHQSFIPQEMSRSIWLRPGWHASLIGMLACWPAREGWNVFVQQKRLPKKGGFVYMPIYLPLPRMETHL